MAAPIFSKASLACAEPLSAVARNACVGSILAELADFVVVVLVVDSNMALILRAFPAEDFRTRRPGRLSDASLIAAGGAAFGKPIRSLGACTLFANAGVEYG